jgi:hypothetical protein
MIFFRHVKTEANVNLVNGRRCVEEANVSGIDSQHIRRVKSEVVSDKRYGSPCPFTRVHRFRNNIETGILWETRLPIFTETRAGENAQLGPVEDRCERTDKCTRWILGGLNQLMQGVKHSRCKWLDCSPRYFPVGPLSELFTEERMERRLLLMHCCRIVSKAVAVSQDGKDIGSRGDL